MTSHNEENPYVEMAMRSATRAAVKVLEEALIHNRKVPIWMDGRVQQQIPTREQIERIRDGIDCQLL